MRLQRFALGLLALCCAAAVQAEDLLSGQVRAQWNVPSAGDVGPLAQANALQPGIAAPPASGLLLETELRASSKFVSATATFQQQKLEGYGWTSRAWFNDATLGEPEISALPLSLKSSAACGSSFSDAVFKGYGAINIR